MRILIDPGHGGLQHGHVSPSGAEEKLLTLELALLLAVKLTIAGREVFLTREKDEDVSHRQRAYMAGQADLTVSLHFHCVGNPLDRCIEAGARVARGEYLSRLLGEAVARATGEPFVYRPTQTRITAMTSKPVAILTLGYLSNPETEAGLLDGSRMNLTVQALGDALLKATERG